MKWVLFLALLQAAAAFSIAPLHQPYAHAVRRALSPGLCFRWVHRELLVWLAKMDETDFDAVYQQQPLEARHCQAVQRCCWQERKSRGRGLQRSLCRRRRRWVSAMCVVMHSMLLATRLYLTHEQRAAKTATLVYAVLIGGGGMCSRACACVHTYICASVRMCVRVRLDKSSHTQEFSLESRAEASHRSFRARLLPPCLPTLTWPPLPSLRLAPRLL